MINIAGLSLILDFMVKRLYLKQDPSNHNERIS